MKIKMRGKTIGELVSEIPTPPPIPEMKIETNITDNEELKNVKFYTLKEILNSENIFPPTLVTLNKVFEKELTLLFKKEVLG